jgi:hypothetical protein
LLFGPPVVGKNHLAAAIGLPLVENGWRVLFIKKLMRSPPAAASHSDCRCRSHPNCHATLAG